MKLKLKWPWLICMNQITNDTFTWQLSGSTGRAHGPGFDSRIRSDSSMLFPLSLHWLLSSYLAPIKCPMPYNMTNQCHSNCEEKGHNCLWAQHGIFVWFMEICLAELWFLLISDHLSHLPHWLYNICDTRKQYRVIFLFLLSYSPPQHGHKPG